VPVNGEQFIFIESPEHILADVGVTVWLDPEEIAVTTGGH
jgi:hypothetical protein